MGDSLGWLALTALVVVWLRVLARHATALRIGRVVVVAFIVRLAVMVVGYWTAHRGLMFPDERTYLGDGRVLAHLWSSGHIPDPTAYNVVGTYQFGYQAFLGAVFTLASPSILVGKLANVLVGTTVVVVGAKLAERLLGRAAAVRTAWLLALFPSLVWWSATLLKESLATVLLTAGLLAASWLPRRRAVWTLAAILPALAAVRVSGAVALGVATLAMVAVAGREVERRWLSRILGWCALLACVAALAVGLVVSRGRLGSLYHHYGTSIDHLSSRYRGSGLARVPYDMGKSLVTPLPWVFGAGTHNWYRALYPGVWVLYAALPLAALGAWRLVRHPEGALLISPIAVALVATALTTGFAFRQRSMVEPAILLLAVAGARNTVQVTRWAAVGLAGGAVGVAIQSGSALGVGLTLAVAVSLVLVGRGIGSRELAARPTDAITTGWVHAAVAPLDLRTLIRATFDRACAGVVALRLAAPVRSFDRDGPPSAPPAWMSALRRGAPPGGDA